MCWWFCSYINSSSYMELWDVSILRAAEYTFIVCIPIAVWMAEKINERWNDEDQ